MKQMQSLVVLFVLSVNLVHGEPPPAIKDGANLFDEGTINRIQQVVDMIRKEHDFDLSIETLKELPNVDEAHFAVLPKNEKEERILKIAQNRADNLGVRGLYLMITLQPRNVKVIGWPADFNIESYGSSVKRNRLRKDLEEGLRENPNKAIRLALDHFHQQLEAARPQEPSPLETIPSMILVGSLIGFWLLLLLVRWRLAAPDAPLPIYQPAMMGSLFGVPSSYWINDRLFQGERPVHTLTQPLIPETESASIPQQSQEHSSEADESSHLIDAPIQTPEEGDRA